MANPNVRTDETRRLRFNEVGKESMRQLIALHKGLLSNKGYVGMTVFGSQTKGYSTTESDIDVNFFLDLPPYVEESTVEPPNQEKRKRSFISQLLSIGDKRRESEQIQRPISSRELAYRSFVNTMERVTPGYFNGKNAEQLFQQYGEYFIYDVSSENLERLIVFGLSELRNFKRGLMSYDIYSFCENNYAYTELRPIYRLFQLAIGDGIQDARRTMFKILEKTPAELTLKEAFMRAIMLRLAQEERPRERLDVEFKGYPKSISEAKKYFNVG